MVNTHYTDHSKSAQTTQTCLAAVPPGHVPQPQAYAALLPQVVPGELTVVTGLPNSGKSEWLDALAVNLAQLHGWRIGMCSLENTPREHGRKLMEKYTCEQLGTYVAMW